MAENTINVKVKQRTDTESNWASKNPVLLKGEMAISSNKNNKYKIGDGTSVWSALSYAKADLSKSDVTTALGYTPPTTNTTYNDVTQSAHGLMTAADKKKLDGIASGATAVTDSTVAGWGYKKTDTNTWRPLGTTADTACAGNDSRLSNARPASDVSAWAKASTKPTYTWNEIGSKPSTFTPASHSHNAISMYGSNTINNTANDTTTKWGSYNNSIHFYSNAKQLTDQPSQYGFLHNISKGDAEVHQVWYEQASGSVYHRGGNASGWAGSWRQFLDTGNYNSYVPTKTGGGASGTWGINITGKATTAGTADVASSVAWSNVSGRPSSLPANGGNSTTVNGYTVNSNVPANAKFTDTTYAIATTSANGLMSKDMVTKLNGIASGATAVTSTTVSNWGFKKTDTNTWRGVQNNLTSTATDQSLSAYQGKVLKDLVDKKTTFTYSSTQPTSPASNAVWIG